MLEAKDQGHRRKCSPKEKVFKNFFKRSQKNKKKERGLQKYFSGKLQNFTIQKIVLSSSRGQGNF